MPMLPHVPTLLASLVAEVPVDPDAPTAHELLRDELTNPIYAQGPSLLSRFFAWLRGLFDGVTIPGASGSYAAIIVVLLVAAAVIVVFFVTGPVRRGRNAARTGVIDLDDTRSADDLVRAAAAAAAVGDFASATLDSIRALVRRAEERAILDPAPGQTALEAADRLAPQFPAQAPALAWAAATFDRVYYGAAPIDAGTWEAVRTLEAEIACTTPLLARQALSGTAS